MTNLDKRNPPLKRVYIKCPVCGRVLKARARECTRVSRHSVYHSNPPYPMVWRIERIPRHKARRHNPDRLRDLIVYGWKERDPWCKVKFIESIEGDFVAREGVFKIVGQRHRKPRGRSPKSK